MSASRICFTLLLLSGCSDGNSTDSAEAALALGSAPTIDFAHIGRLFNDGHYRIQAGAGDADGDLAWLEARVGSGPVIRLEDNFFIGWIGDLGTAATLGLGTRVCSLTAVDRAGHRTTEVLVFQVVPPTTAPVIDYLSAFVGSNVADLTAFIQVNAHDVDGDLQRTEYELDGSGTWTVLERYSPVVGTASSSIELRGLSRGLHTVRARGIDVRGAVGAVIGPASFRFIDPVAPSCVLDRIVISTRCGFYETQGTATDLNRNLSQVEIRVDGGEWRFASGLYLTDETQPLAVHVSYPPVSRGVHTVEARVIDGTSLSGTCGPVSFTAQDTPAVDSIKAAGGAGTASASGTTSDFENNVTRVEVSYDGADRWWTATGTRSWSYTWTDFPPGPEHRVYARAIDSTGLRSEEVFSPAFAVTAKACPWWRPVCP